MNESPFPDSGQTAAATPDQLKRSAELSSLPAAVPITVGDRYELQDMLAKGGMGAVYKAWDKIFKRTVAVKIVLDSLASPNVLYRFRHEALIAGQLQHPNIPPVYDIGTYDGTKPFLAMKLVKGRTLDDHIKHPGVDTPNLIAVFENIAQAIGYAHSRGVIHRDLKPQNVMVGAFGEVQVMDWGLAKVLDSERSEAEQTEFDPGATTGLGTKIGDPDTENDSHTVAGSVLGTPAYMPPEQAIGAIDQVNERSDVFGLGAILCAILTKHPVYVGGSAEATRQLAAKGRTEDAFKRLDSTSSEPELVALVKKCLAAEPMERLANGDEVAREVSRIRMEADARALQAEVHRERTLVKADEYRKRRRMQMILLSGIVFVSSIGMIASLWYSEIAYKRRIDAENAQRQSKIDEIAAIEAKSIAENEKTVAFQARREADSARKNAEWSAYISQIALAKHEWEQGNAPSAYNILYSTNTDYRGWEFHHLKHAFTRDRIWGGSHGGNADCLAVDSKGKRVAVCGTKTLTCWEAASGKRLFQVPINSERATISICFCAEDKLIVIGEGIHETNTPIKIHMWDSETGKQLNKPITVNGAIRNICPLDHEQIVLSTANNTIYWINVKDGKIVHSFDVNPPLSCSVIAISNDRKLIATGGGSSPIQIRQAKNGILIKMLENDMAQKVNQYTIVDLAFSHDDQLLSGAGVGFSIWNIVTNKNVIASRPSGTNHINRIAWSSDNKSFYLSAENRAILHIDGLSGNEIKRYYGHTAPVTGIASFQSNIYSCGRDGKIFGWQAHTNTGTNRVIADGRTTAWFNDIEFSGDGKQLIAADGYYGYPVQRWEIPSGRKLTNLTGNVKAVTSANYSADSQFVLTASEDARVRLFDSSGAIKRTYNGHKDKINGIVSGHDGKWFASYSNDGQLIVWDMLNNQKLRTQFESKLPILAGCVSRDRLAIGLSDGTIIIWNTENWGDEIRLIRNPSFTGISHLNKLSLSFSPDGTVLASGGSDSNLTIWDIKAQKLLWSKSITVSPINDLAFLPGGKQLVTAIGKFSEPGELLIWDINSEHITYTLRGLSREAKAVAVNYVNSSIAACDHNGNIYMWEQESDIDNAISKFDGYISEAEMYHRKGNTLLIQKSDFQMAIEMYKQGLKLSPDVPSTHNNLAWIYSTGPDELRNGKLAVEHALTACKIANWSNAYYIDMLACAFAETGDFDKAVEYELKAMSFPDFQKRHGELIRPRIEQFKKKQAYRDPFFHKQRP